MQTIGEVKKHCRTVGEGIVAAGEDRREAIARRVRWQRPARRCVSSSTRRIGADDVPEGENVTKGE